MEVAVKKFYYIFTYDACIRLLSDKIWECSSNESPHSSNGVRSWVHGQTRRVAAGHPRSLMKKNFD